MKDMYTVLLVVSGVVCVFVLIFFATTNGVKENCLKQYNNSCDYYECMGNHTSGGVTATMYYSQKTNCLLESLLEKK